MVLGEPLGLTTLEVWNSGLDTISCCAMRRAAASSGSLLLKALTMICLFSTLSRPFVRSMSSSSTTSSAVVEGRAKDNLAAALEYSPSTQLLKLLPFPKPLLQGET